jgi:diguanylate cyclase
MSATLRSETRQSLPIEHELRPRLPAPAGAGWLQERVEAIEGAFGGTNRPDRQSLLVALNAAVREAIASGHPAAAILLDLNNFADINAAWGPAAGDEALEATAARVAAFAAARFGDSAAGAATAAGRLDADHFLIAIPDAPGLEGLKAAASELVRIASGPLALSSRTIAVSARAAIVQVPAHGRTVTAILGRGFRLLNGPARGSVDGVAVSQATASADTSLMALERDLAAALATDQLSVFLQPKVEAATGVVAGAEALARWQHPERGWVPPTLFIEAAERSGLIFDLGLRILRDACLASKALSAGGSSLRIAVNVSAHQLAHPDFLARFLEVVDQEGVKPQMLEIEVTETAAMMGGERVLASLHALRRCGIGIAIDDFGTGFSNLATLGTLPADTVKIDRSLVVGIEQSPRAAALFDIAVKLGDTFGLITVAEGVETPGQFEKVRDSGCDLVQGFFTGRPAPAEDFSERFLSGR